ncbi:kynureninase [Qipengyuania sp. ASV99]|uniref:kynureninase n=1 Tax=Qipengyuania sp. ASV99 TaxID=3399681 RepID=UPI003A4C67AF
MQNLIAKAQALDEGDPLAPFRNRFHQRDGLIYLDGNSLGCMPLAASQRVRQVLEGEWAEGLITSWLGAQWATAPQRIGDKIAQLIGAQPGEVIAADSTSINIFKALTAALSLRPDRSVILTETTNFPTDSYMMQGIEQFSDGRVKAQKVAPEDVVDAVDESTAAVLLTHVHYKSAAARDLAETTRRIQQAGALAIWDLSHSTGALELDLTAANVDFAVGCGYKFLNGGPGAPAFIYVARRNQHAQSVLSGWFGHAQPFAFDEQYEPAKGADRFLCGTPYVLGLAALEVGVDLMLEADMAQIRAKSVAFGDLLIDAMAPLCDHYGFALTSPSEAKHRGSHVAYAHPHAYAMVQALRELDVIADFRTPDVIRFGLTPLTLRYADIPEAVVRLEQVCRKRSWDKAEYRTLAAVT